MENMKPYIAEMVKLYMQAESLSDQEKDIKVRIKESGGNPAIVSAVAKAIVSNKVEELKIKSETVIDLIELSRD